MHGVYIFVKISRSIDTCQPIVGNRSKISLCVYYVFIHIFALTLDVSKVYGGIRLNPVYTIAIIYYVLRYQQSIWWG